MSLARSKFFVLAATAAVICCTSQPAVADTTADEPSHEQVQDVTTTSGEDLVVLDESRDETATRQYLNDSATQGILTDSAAVDVAVVEDVGTIVGTHELEGVRSLSRTESELVSEGEVVGETEAYDLKTVNVPDELDDVDQTLPMGPGSSSLVTVREGDCYVVRGNEAGNQMAWCYKQKWLDGGNGLKAYGQRDDDGSNVYDYHLYIRTATVRPSDEGAFDWGIQAGHIYSWPNYNTIVYRESRITGWEPDKADCAGNDLVSLDVKVVSVDLGSCSSGTEISIADDDGRFKQYFDFNSGQMNSKSLSFRTGIRSKQGTVPLMLDDNYAKFRKTFRTTTDTIDD